MKVLHCTYIEDDKLSYISDKLLTRAQTFTNYNVDYRKLILFNILYIYIYLIRCENNVELNVCRM